MAGAGAMIRPRRWLEARLLVRAACVLGLVALASTAVAVLYPYALPVVFAMSVGQGLGVLAFVCYLLAIVAEVLHHEEQRRASGARPEANLAGEARARAFGPDRTKS